MLHTFICLAAIACARICLIGGRPNQPPSQICRELGCPSVMATTQNLPHLLDVLRRSGVEAAAVNGWNGVYSDLVLRSNGALAPYNPQTNNANAAFCVFGYQQPVGTPVPVPCAQPLQPTYRPPTIEISSACLKPQQPHSQLTTLQPTYRPPTIEVSSTCLKPQQPHSQLTTLQPTYRPPTIEIASPCHRPQPHSLPGYPNVNRCLFNMSNPSYDDRMSPDRNTHAEYSDVDEHSRYSEPSSDTNNGFYNQRPRSRSHSTNQLWPSPMPKCLPVNISAASPCGSVLPKQWQRHCYPKEHHRKPLYPLIRYNYNFNYYYVVNPFEENNHPSLCKNSYVYPYRRHRKRRKCPLIRKLEHCIRCKPHERCMGEASFCDPCQRKGFDVKICKKEEERSDERCKDRCEERSEEIFDDRSDDRSSSHCRLKRERDSSERSMFEREGAIA